VTLRRREHAAQRDYADYNTSSAAPSSGNATAGHNNRHSFAVHTLIDWHRQGADISALLPVLSTYLGHVEPKNTYWYLSAVPELMQLVAARLEHGTGES
jgi:integrase/recombinase XerD